jgi:hypothetical protein
MDRSGSTRHGLGAAVLGQDRRGAAQPRRGRKQLMIFLGRDGTGREGKGTERIGKAVQCQERQRQGRKHYDFPWSGAARRGSAVPGRAGMGWEMQGNIMGESTKR